jgi:hypothetical protein
VGNTNIVFFLYVGIFSSKKFRTGLGDRMYHPRRSFGLSSRFLRDFFETSRRIPEGFPKRLREVSNKPRRMCGDGTAVIRKKSKVKSEKSKNIHFFVLRPLQPFWFKNI